MNSPKLKSLLQAYLNPMIEANIDHLVLGCSHYPYLIPLLRELLPESVKIIDSGEAVAKQTKTLLEEDKLLRKERTKPKLQFYTNSDTSTLEYLLQSYGDTIQIEQHDF